MATSPEITDVLAEVGARLTRVRTERDATMTQLAATAISRSTLSGLGSGPRKPSLGSLLPIAQALRTPLDELVGAPEVGDPHSGCARSSAAGGSWWR